MQHGADPSPVFPGAGAEIVKTGNYVLNRVYLPRRSMLVAEGKKKSEARDLGGTDKTTVTCMEAVTVCVSMRQHRQN